MTRPTLTPLPLVHDGDSFIVDLEPVGIRCVRILRILRFNHNQNTTGIEESFRDLDIDTKRAVVKQINRKHVGKTVLI